MSFDEKVAGELLRLPEIVDFHYDDRDWSVGGIGVAVWKPKFRGHCVSGIDRMKRFLEMPYVEDVFRGDDEGRYVWRSKLSRRKNCVFDDLTRSTIFSIAKLNGILLSESFMARQHRGRLGGSLIKYVNDCEILMPFSEESGINCKASREEYDVMEFEKKRAHVYEIKENVFNFLSCLANNS